MATMIGELRKMYEEKAFRTSMYVSRQANEAVQMENTVNIYDLLKAEDGKHYLIFNDDTCASTSVCKIGCQSMFMDGKWGYWNYEETNFYPFENYGKTWCAVTQELACSKEFNKIEVELKVNLYRYKITH